MTSYLKSLVEKSLGTLCRSAATRASRRSLARRNLAFESLETRELLAVVALEDLSVSENTGEKPQSKVWEHAGQWYSVMPSSGGSWIYRLDGTSWTQTLQLSGNNATHADVKVVDDVAHILLFDGGSSELASVEYVGGNYQLWSQRPGLVNIDLGGVETATLDIDSTGRMWVAGEASGNVNVWYADGTYNSWSAPIAIDGGLKSDDIAAVTALPDGTIGVLWSDQSSNRFGFRVHVDGASPTEWSPNEVPAGQSAQGAGGGMADDHLNIAVGSDGTLYAAVKTSYDSSGYAKIALLVRRPWGTWDDLYQVDTSGTRAIVLLNELERRLIVAYPSSTGGGSIVYRETSIDDISFGARQTLISGNLNDPTSIKGNFTDEVVVLAESGGKAKGVLFSFDALIQLNQPPVVDSGEDQLVDLGVAAMLDGTVSDDGLPAASGAVTIGWSLVSGPGSVTFADPTAVDTTADFSAPGEYVLLLTADDGDASRSDQVIVRVVNNTLPGGGTSTPADPVTVSFQDGLFPLVTYAGTNDTELASAAPGTNYGSATSLSVDGSTDTGALVEWDLSYIPTDSIVVSAQIELSVTSASTAQVQTQTTPTRGRGARGSYSSSSTTTSVPIQYNVYALQQAWDEISATWDQYAAGLPWNGAGAGGSSDYDATLLAQAAPTSAGAYTIALNDAGLEAVQSWISDPSSNFGLILQDYSGSDGGFAFNSSESNTAALRPKLTVTYQPSSGSTPTNQAPTVDAGTNQNVQLPGTAALNGTVTDDGLPSGNVTTTWTQVSGPGNVAFANSAAVDTTASFTQAGTYVLRLSADDGDLQSSDTVTITVQAPAPVNVAPTVDAGTNQNVQLPGTAALNGTVTDDGLPSGNVTHHLDPGLRAR